MIFFDHIKGCSRDTTAYNTGLWTWIQFAGNSDSAPYPEIVIAKGSNGINKVGSDGATKNFLINKDSFSDAYTWTAQQDATIKSLGQIITSLQLMLRNCGATKETQQCYMLETLLS